LGLGTAQSPKTPANPVDESSDRVVARVAMNAITMGDLRDEAKYRRLQGSTDPQMGDLLIELLDRQLVLASWPEKRSLPPDVETRKAEVASKAMLALENQLGGPDGLAEALDMLAWSPGALRAFAEQRYIENYKIRQVVQRKFKAPTPEEVAAYAKELEAKGDPVEVYSLSQILLSFAASAPPEGTKVSPQVAARERALEALSRLDAGAAFATVAREVSDDSYTAPLGGRMGDFTPSELAPLFRQVVSALAVGEVSQPIIGPNGVHLVRLDRKRTPSSRLIAQRFREARRELIRELRNDYAVQFVDPELKALEAQMRDGSFDRAREAAGADDWME